MTLAELVFHYLEVRERNKENEVWAKCPFCGDEQYRMGINLQTGQAQCFRGKCGFKTSSKKFLFSKLAELFGVSNSQLSEPDSWVKPKFKSSHQKLSRIILPEEFEPLWRDINDEIGLKALEYVRRKRKITRDQIWRHRLGFCAAGKYTHRVIFPVFYRQKVVSFTGRDFTDQSPLRYLNSEGTKFFYNVPSFIPGRKFKGCVLSEGPIDALAVERAEPIFQSIGKLGTGLTEIQQKILLKFAEVIMWPDPDDAGVEWAVEVGNFCKEKSIKVSVVLSDKEDASDPGKLGETHQGIKEIRRRIHQRKLWTPDMAMLLRTRIPL